MKNIIKEQSSRFKIDKVFMVAVNQSLMELYGSNSQTWGGVGERGSQKKGGVINFYSINELISQKEKSPGFNIEGGEWSILNYFDTNPKVRRYILSVFNIENKTEKTNNLVNLKKIYNWILTNKERFFTPGPILTRLVKLNFEGYYRGLRNEKKAYDLIKNHFEKNTDLEISGVNIPGATSDRKGVDFTVTNLETNRVFTFQAKPLSSFEETPDGKYIIHSYNIKRLKDKDVDFFIFTTDKREGAYVFKNKKNDYEILDDNYVVFNYPPVKKLE